MTDTTELAKRAVACKAWRWMPGMMCNWGRVLWVDGTHAFIWQQAVTLGPMPGDAVPDLGDPATLGCLLHLVREAWPAAPAVTSRHGNYAEGIGHSFLWVCSYCTVERWLQSHGDTEAEALVKALEMKVQND